MPEFSRAEILSAHERRLAFQSADDWAGFVQCFTADAIYVEHHEGTFRGRREIGEWLVPVMELCKGWTFPIEWTVLEGNRLVYKWLNRLPGSREDGGYFEFAGVTIAEYAGDGLWSYQEDIYNWEETERVLTEWSQRGGAGD